MSRAGNKPNEQAPFSEQTRETPIASKAKKNDEAFGKRGRYSVRLTGAFAMVALMTAFIAVLMLALVWNQQFEAYRKANMTHMVNTLAIQAAATYEQSGQNWNNVDFSGFSEMYGGGDVAFRITDNNGNILADSRNKGIGSTQNDPESKNLLGMLGSLGGEPSQTVKAGIYDVNKNRVGTAYTWILGGNALLSDTDLAFRSATYRAVGIAALVAVVLASVFGYLFARQLVNPINRITDTARAVRGGDLSARTGMTGGDEISDLGYTFDQMTTGIEKDRKLERQLTSDVAHELRTPLMAIQATVEAMADGVLPADEEHLYTVGNETVRMSRLVDAILELTRLERGSLPFTMGKVDMSAMIHEVVVAHEALFDSCQMKLHSSIENGIYVWGDPDRLRQAVGNIMSNAVRYTGEGGSVSVLLKTQGDQMVLEISDTGIGIKEENLQKVFSRFWRDDQARNRASGGLGIGLAVTKEIVDRHDGRITARNRIEGGAAFTIYLPLYHESAAEDSGKMPRVRGNQRKRV